MTSSSFPAPLGRNRTTRVSISLPHPVYQCLLRRCDQEGRSFSNLCAVLLEIMCRQG